MKGKLILIIKGALIGVANIIPGVSGGTLAITLGIYEDLISAITTFFSNFKKNNIFLITIGIGAGLGIVLVSKFITISLDKYPIQTNIFFIGLIMGGMPTLIKKAKTTQSGKISKLIFLFVFLALMATSFLNPSKQVNFDNLNYFGYFKLFLIGIIGAGTMVIPGISGSFVLMILGYYRPILDTINDFVSALKGTGDLLNNFLILLPFGLGILIGIIIIAKIIEYFLKKFETQTYYAIIGFVLGSVFLILKPLTIINLTFPIILFSLIFGVIGFTIAYKLGSGD